MPSAQKYPQITPIVFGQNGEYSFTQEDLEAIFTIPSFVRRVEEFRGPSNIGKLLYIMTTFDCGIDQLKQILTKTDSNAMGAVSLLSTYGKEFVGCGIDFRSLSLMLRHTECNAIETMEAIHCKLQALTALGFKKQGVSYMLCDLGARTFVVMDSILANALEIKRTSGLGMHDIACIIGCGARISCDIARDTLWNMRKLRALGYTKADICSMLDGMQGSTLYIFKAAIHGSDILRKQGFSISDICYMLRGAEVNAQDLMTEAYARIVRLKHLGFSTTDLSCMFHGLAKCDLDILVPILYTKTEMLKQMGFQPQSIACLLSNVGCVAPYIIKLIIEKAAIVIDLGYNVESIVHTLRDQGFEEYPHLLDQLIQTLRGAAKVRDTQASPACFPAILRAPRVQESLGVHSLVSQLDATSKAPCALIPPSARNVHSYPKIFRGIPSALGDIRRQESDVASPSIEWSKSISLRGATGDICTRPAIAYIPT